MESLSVWYMYLCTHWFESESYLFLALSFSISVITNTCVNSIQREILFCILYMYVHVYLF